MLLVDVPHTFPHPSATYVKVYLLENGACLAKKKTKVTKKTCDPLYQQALLFEEGPQGKVLQVSVTGGAGQGSCPKTSSFRSFFK